MTEAAERTLDWRPRYDERSRGYGVAEVLETSTAKLPTRGRLWDHGPVLDQGAEGACVGMGCAGEAAAQPVPVPGVDLAYALGWYREAQHVDDWPGEGYSGTSVLAGLLVGRSRGLYTGFRWVFSVEELAAAVVELGPVVLGITWTAGAYDAPGGVLQFTGEVVGGHCLLVLGFMPHVPELDDGPGFLVLNSWGEDYGNAGTAWVSVDNMRGRCAAGWEAAVPEGRSLGKITAAEPKEEQQPATEAAAHTRTLEVAAVDVQVGDRVAVGKSWTTVQDRQHLASGLLTIVQLDTASRGVQRYGDQDRVRVRRPVEE